MLARLRTHWLALVFLSTVLACNTVQIDLLPATPSPAETAAPFSTITPTQTTSSLPSLNAPAATATEFFTQIPLVQSNASSSLPEEAILILEPGPGSRVTSPVRVSGMADSTFEQNLVVRLVLDDGSQLALAPTTIQSELGQRGPFELDLSFDNESERQGFIQVYASSPRDGGITHLAAVGVTLVPAAPVDIRPVSPHPEQIVIYQPVVAQTISGGVAHVEGFALASFEQTLVVEVYDGDGNRVGMQAVIVQAPDMGIPGPFSADVPYQVGSPGPGRILVRDPSPAFDGDIHLASIEITLEP